MNTPARWAGWRLPKPKEGEVPVNGNTLRLKLSPKSHGGRRVPLGSSRFCAIKRAMGIRGTRYYFESQFLAFLADFPDFSEKEVYDRDWVDRFEVGKVVCFMHGPHEYRMRVVALDETGKPAQLTLA